MDWLVSTEVVCNVGMAEWYVAVVSNSGMGYGNDNDGMGMAEASNDGMGM